MIARYVGAKMQSRPAYAPSRVQKLRALHDWILVADMQFTERFTESGIVLPNDNGTGSGIRPRWGRVYALGPRQTQVQVGQWICVAHGRWTRGIDIEDNQGVLTIRRVDPQDILLVSDTEPQDNTMSDAINVTPRQR